MLAVAKKSMLMVVCVMLLISAVDSHCVRDESQFNFVSRATRLENCRLHESENGVPAGRLEVGHIFIRVPSLSYS